MDIDDFDPPSDPGYVKTPEAHSLGDEEGRSEGSDIDPYTIDISDFPYQHSGRNSPTDEYTDTPAPWSPSCPGFRPVNAGFGDPLSTVGPLPSLLAAERLAAYSAAARAAAAASAALSSIAPSSAAPSSTAPSSTAPSSTSTIFHNAPYSTVRPASAPQPVLPNLPALQRSTRALTALYQLPVLREVAYRPGRSLSSLDRAVNHEAIIGTCVGSIAAVACVHCSSRYGCFAHCVVVAGYFHGACTNCHYNSEGNRCSFRSGSSKPRRKRSSTNKEDIEPTTLTSTTPTTSAGGRGRRLSRPGASGLSRNSRGSSRGPPRGPRARSQARQDKYDFPSPTPGPRTLPDTTGTIREPRTIAVQIPAIVIAAEQMTIEEIAERRAELRLELAVLDWVEKSRAVVEANRPEEEEE